MGTDRRIHNVEHVDFVPGAMSLRRVRDIHTGEVFAVERIFPTWGAASKYREGLRPVGQDVYEPAFSESLR